MNKFPEWILNENWAIGRDLYNWTLFQKSGDRWRAKSFYASPEQLLKSFYKKLTRVEPVDGSLIEHIEQCLDVAQAAADLFAEHVSTLVLPLSGDALAAASTALEGEVKHAS